MIYKDILLEQFDPRIKTAVQTFHFGLGKHYDLQILYGRLSEDLFYLFEKQGGDLMAINKLRSSFNLHLLNQNSNIKVVKWNWGVGLITGMGCCFTVQRASYRYQLNDDILNAIRWFQQEFHDFVVDFCENDKYCTIYIALKNASYPKSL